MNYLISSVTVPANSTKRIDVGEGIPIQVWCESALAFQVYGRYDESVARELILNAPTPSAFSPLSLFGGTVRPAHRYIEVDNLSMTQQNIFHFLIAQSGAEVQAVFTGFGGGGGGGLSGSGATNQITVWSGASSITGYTTLTYNAATRQFTHLATTNGELQHRIEGQNTGTSSFTRLWVLAGTNDAVNFSKIALEAFAPSTAPAPGEAQIRMKGSFNRILTEGTFGDAAALILGDERMRIAKENQIGVTVKDRLAVGASVFLGNPLSTEQGVLETIGPNSSLQLWRRDLNVYPTPLTLVEGHRFVLLNHLTLGGKTEFRVFTDGAPANVLLYRLDNNGWLRVRGQLFVGNTTDSGVLGSRVWDEVAPGRVDLFSTAVSHEASCRLSIYAPTFVPNEPTPVAHFKVRLMQFTPNGDFLLNSTINPYFFHLAGGDTVDSVGVPGPDNQKLAITVFSNNQAMVGLNGRFVVSEKHLLHGDIVKLCARRTGGIYFITSEEDGDSAIIGIRRHNDDVVILSETLFGLFTTTAGNGGTINVYYDAVAQEYKLENRTGTSRIFIISTFRTLGK